MPSLEWNHDTWDKTHAWPEAGDEWSSAWGDSDMHWRGALKPRLRGYLPAKRIVEIAPGYGRWTEKLGRECESLIAVDLSPRCIEKCRERFSDRPHMRFYVGDGRSLPMVEDDSADLVFSFDSLVHVERDVMAGYVSEVARVLSKGGVAFLHHSNLGAYPAYFRAFRRAKALLSPSPRETDGFGDGPGGDEARAPAVSASADSPIGRWIRQALWLDSDRSRALSVTAEEIAKMADEVGLARVSQELVNWGTRRTIDCLTVLARREASLADMGIRRNPRFMEEAALLRQVSSLYPLRPERV